MNNREAVRQYLADQDRTIHDLLDRYVKAWGCPCHSPRFEYWVSKEQGPGWQDNFQNSLIDEALKLSTFKQRKPEKPLYFQEADVTCTACGREWQYFAEEWRMLAFRNQLKPLQPSQEAQSLVAQGASQVGGNVFATAGQEPDDKPRLSLPEWLAFMSEGVPQVPVRRTFALERVLNWLRLGS